MKWMNAGDGRWFWCSIDYQKHKYEQQLAASLGLSGNSLDFIYSIPLENYENIQYYQKCTHVGYFNGNHNNCRIDFYFQTERKKKTCNSNRSYDELGLRLMPALWFSARLKILTDWCIWQWFVLCQNDKRVFFSLSLYHRKRPFIGWMFILQQRCNLWNTSNFR